ncbi:hypothetical protein [Xylanimonas allomyrinae]|uniref:phage terminase small subunit n=1 Tax=Xylanimonas allomyrinae TaxID=2509459 RepID=UPI001B883E85|nr:hypothetical protein [Xylanimonas allomyrinae]
MPGPTRNAAKPNSRAHRTPSTTATRALVVLPDSCDLPVPRLPRGREWSAEEKRLWKDLWTSPQANVWDDSYIAAVAAYVCHASAIYRDAASAWQAQEFRHLGDKLGLTPAGMLALGWVVE